MTYKTVLFDIDGTLCDPGESIIESARYALSELGVDETVKAALRRFVGPPLEHAFRDYYQFDASKIARAVELFREKHLEDSRVLYRAYPGVAKLLSDLHQSGATTAIVTSKIEHIAKNALESTGLLKYFNVIGAQQPHEVVEKRVVLQRVIDQLGVDGKSDIVMVGDRKHDVEAANAHGVDSIGVLWGYGSHKELAHAGATFIAESADDIADIVIDGS